MRDEKDRLPEAIENEFYAAVDRARAEWPAALDAVCARHVAFADHLRRLFAAFVADADRLQRAGDATAAVELRAGDRVGPFSILEEVGHGGMGTVYLADQKDPVRRRVALKVIKLGMDTKAVLSRFAAERQALAMMDHTSIAKVLEAGATPQGRPYFAMEYVKGVPITRYCDANKLSVEDRLALFRQVCSGVQHAHTKGVIHRDLTPNNVLVTVQDGKATAKIIDFGLARATNQRLTEKTLYTEQGVILGTPEYMSPEQAGLNALDIDMRTDVYTLGVLLYELLTGKLPFESTELRSVGYEAMCKTLREQDPPRPSTKVTTVQGGTDAAAKLRRTDAATLLKRLRGDLDWIVMKCLEKDRTRRYETVSELAADVQRHLEYEPVLARAPSVRYRLRKMARRYRGQLLAAAAVVMALVAGLAGTMWFAFHAKAQATEARRQAAIAEAALAGEATKAKEAAQHAAIAERNATMLVAKVREFDQLAGIMHLERLQTAMEELAVPWSDLTAAQIWLADADRVLALRPELEKTVADLRSRALPATPEELARDRATHPRWAKWQKLSAQLAELEQVQAMQGGGSVALPSLTAEEEAMTPSELNGLAWPLVDPKDHEGKQAHAPRALALAAHAWIKSEAAGAKDCNLADTLAWAWFWNGKDDEAVQQSKAALALAPEDRKDEFGGLLANLRERIAGGEGKAAVRANAEFVGREVVRLRSELRDLGYRFESEAQGFLHDVLTDLLAKLAAFATADRSGVFTRVCCAELTVSHPKARATWRHAAEAVTKADGVVASALYKEHPIKLRPQLGLVPIGMNPVTKLWEFYELRSAWDPVTVPDAAALEIPVHDAHGNIKVGDDTGIVLVLLPGGTFMVGAQRTDKDGANYDPDAQGDEGPPHGITLAPFFLARHELTQGQWRRLGGKLDQRLFETGDAFPVASQSWLTCDALLRSLGVTLPTEAQWEYGCRGGTTTPRWKSVAASSVPETDIRFALVGSEPGNPYGLCETDENLAEWCADWFGYYNDPWRPGDGLRSFQGNYPSFRVVRGCGGFANEHRFLRSAHRFSEAPTVRKARLGVRPARAITP